MFVHNVEENKNYSIEMPSMIWSRWCSDEVELRCSVFRKLQLSLPVCVCCVIVSFVCVVFVDHKTTDNSDRLCVLFKFKSNSYQLESSFWWIREKKTQIEVNNEWMIKKNPKNRFRKNHKQEGKKTQKPESESPIWEEREKESTLTSAGGAASIVVVVVSNVVDASDASMVEEQSLGTWQALSNVFSFLLFFLCSSANPIPPAASSSYCCHSNLLQTYHCLRLQSRPLSADRALSPGWWD